MSLLSEKNLPVEEYLISDYYPFRIDEDDVVQEVGMLVGMEEDIGGFDCGDSFVHSNPPSRRKLQQIPDQGWSDYIMTRPIIIMTIDAMLRESNVEGAMALMSSQKYYVEHYYRKFVCDEPTRMRGYVKSHAVMHKRLSRTLALMQITLDQAYTELSLKPGEFCAIDVQAPITSCLRTVVKPYDMVRRVMKDFQVHISRRSLRKPSVGGIMDEQIHFARVGDRVCDAMVLVGNGSRGRLYTYGKMFPVMFLSISIGLIMPSLSSDDGEVFDKPWVSKIPYRSWRFDGAEKYWQGFARLGRAVLGKRFSLMLESHTESTDYLYPYFEHV